MPILTLRTPRYATGDPIVKGRPNMLGAALLKKLPTLAAGETLELDDGRYHLGYNHLEFPSSVTVLAPPGALAWITSDFAKDFPGHINPITGKADIWCTFELSNGLLLRNLTFESTVGPGDEDILIGYSIGKDATHGGAEATIDSCILKGIRWCYYDWSNGGNKGIVKDTGLVCTRWVAANAGSSGATSGYLDLIRSTLSASSAGTTVPGGERQESIGIIGRGGITRSFDCQVRLYGDPNSPLVAAAWIDKGASPHNTLEFYDSSSIVSANGAARCADLVNDLPSATFKQSGGTGSGAGGAFSKIGNIQSL